MGGPLNGIVMVILLCVHVVCQYSGMEPGKSSLDFDSQYEYYLCKSMAY